MHSNNFLILKILISVKAKVTQIKMLAVLIIQISDTHHLATLKVVTGIRVIMIAIDQDSLATKGVFRNSTHLVAIESHHPKNQFQKVDLEVEIEMIEEDTMIAITDLTTIEEITEAIIEILETIEVTSTKEKTEVATNQETMMIIETIAVEITTEVAVIREEAIKEEILILHKSLAETTQETEHPNNAEEAIAEITSLLITEVVTDQISRGMITINPEITTIGEATEVTEAVTEAATEEEAVTEVATEVEAATEVDLEVAEVADSMMKSQKGTPLMKVRPSKLLRYLLLILVTLVIINKWAMSHHILKTDS